MTLSQTAVITKQVIIISIIALILGIAGFIGYKIWHAYYLANLPPVEEKPDTKFGLLPQPDFPKASVSSSNFSYTLDTSTGSLPRVGIDKGFEKILKVYFVIKSFATFLSPDRSQTLAEKLDISTGPQVLSETNYLFKQDNKSLTVNLDTGNFVFLKEATISGQEALDDDNKLVSDFKKVLETLGVFKEELNSGRTKINLLRAEGNKLIPTTLRVETAAARISIWQQKLDDKSIFTPNFNQALIYAIVIKSANDIENYLSLNFTYYPIDATTFATYPAKSAEGAFEDLKSGKGVVIIEPEKPEVSITAVYLGYYLSENYSPYLHPIYVFEGPNFAAYVPAISSEFLNPAM